MDLELKERLQNYESVLSLYKFFIRTICGLRENFDNEKIEIMFCEYDGNIEILYNEQMETNCNYHKLLTKFTDIMKNNFFTEEQKCDGFLNLYEIDKHTFGPRVHIFYFCKENNQL